MTALWKKGWAWIRGWFSFWNAAGPEPAGDPFPGFPDGGAQGPGSEPPSVCDGTERTDYDTVTEFISEEHIDRHVSINADCNEDYAIRLPPTSKYGSPQRRSDPAPRHQEPPPTTTPAPRPDPRCPRDEAPSPKVDPPRCSEKPVKDPPLQDEDPKFDPWDPLPRFQDRQPAPPAEKDVFPPLRRGPPREPGAPPSSAFANRPTPPPTSAAGAPPEPRARPRQKPAAPPKSSPPPSLPRPNRSVPASQVASRDSSQGGRARAAGFQQPQAQQRRPEPTASLSSFGGDCEEGDAVIDRPISFGSFPSQGRVGWGAEGSQAEDVPVDPGFRAASVPPPQFTSTRRSLPEPKNQQAPVGLVNIGSTCFMNSVLQMLAHIDRRTQFMSAARGRMASAFREILQDMRRTRSPIRPGRFKAVVNEAMPFFGDSAAHDAFEFLVQLLDIMHNDMGGWGSVISQLFYGEIVAVRTFRCGAVEISDDQPAFWMLPLPPTRTTLQLDDCIREWRAVEPMDKDNPLWCSRHKGPEPFTMQMRVKQFSPYVVIQLNRFRNGQGHRSKDNRCVVYPSSFESRHVADTDTGRYHLVGVVCHQGWEYGGHYTCLVGDPATSTWHNISDATVTPVTREEVVRDDAYILFYEQEASAPIPGRR